MTLEGEVKIRAGDDFPHFMKCRSSASCAGSIILRQDTRVLCELQVRMNAVTFHLETEARVAGKAKSRQP